MLGLQKFLVVIGRIFISLIFLFAAYLIVSDWQSAEESITQAMNTMINMSRDTAWTQDFLEKALPMTSFILMIGLAFLVLGGLLLFFGITVRFAALLLLLVIIPNSLFFHSFWLYESPDQKVHLIAFLKDFAIIGALLILLAKGGSCCKKKKPAEGGDKK